VFLPEYWVLPASGWQRAPVMGGCCTRVVPGQLQQWCLMCTDCINQCPAQAQSHGFCTLLLLPVAWMDREAQQLLVGLLVRRAATWSSPQHPTSQVSFLRGASDEASSEPAPAQWGDQLVLAARERVSLHQAAGAASRLQACRSSSRGSQVRRSWMHSIR